MYSGKKIPHEEHRVTPAARVARSFVRGRIKNIDMETFFDNVSHNTLIPLTTCSISDKKILGLH